MVIVLPIVFCTILLAVGYIAYSRGYRKRKQEVEKEVEVWKERAETYIGVAACHADRLVQLESEVLAQQTMLREREETLKKLTNQKKSSEIRTGLIAEQMAPFLHGFPYSPGDALFLGRPIDFVVFNETGVHFVEVKSGKAQLTQSQRQVRDHITSGAVTFEIYRVEGE